MGQLLKQAQKMQEQLIAARATAAEQEVEGHAGGGVVKVKVTGDLDFRGVTIDPSAVDPHDVEMLEDLVLAAIRDAVAKAGELTDAAMGDIDVGGLGLPGGAGGGPGGLFG
jgi:DNA-binding YbaB/EbfC family protein